MPARTFYIYVPAAKAKITALNYHIQCVASKTRQKRINIICLDILYIGIDKDHLSKDLFQLKLKDLIELIGNSKQKYNRILNQQSNRAHKKA